MDRRSFTVFLVVGQVLAQQKKQDAPKKPLTELELRQRVKKIVMEQLGVDEAQVVDTAKIIDDLGADSLDIVELIMALEKEFHISISDKDAEKVCDAGRATVRAVMAYLMQRLHVTSGSRRLAHINESGKITGQCCK